MAYKTIFSICPKRIQKEVVGNVGNCKEFSVSLEIRGLNHPSIRIIGLEYSHPIIRNRWNTLRNLAYWAIARGASSPALPWWLLGWEKIGWPDGECGKGGAKPLKLLGWSRYIDKLGVRDCFSGDGVKSWVSSKTDLVSLCLQNPSKF